MKISALGIALLVTAVIGIATLAYTQTALSQTAFDKFNTNATTHAIGNATLRNSTAVINLSEDNKKGALTADDLNNRAKICAYLQENNTVTTGSGILKMTWYKHAYQLPPLEESLARIGVYVGCSISSFSGVGK